MDSEDENESETPEDISDEIPDIEEKDNQEEVIENIETETASVYNAEVNILYSGEIDESYGHITWSIDTNGKLIISGTGEWSEPGRKTVENDYINPPDYSINTKTPWLKYNKEIKSAEVTLNGTEDFSFMFYMCPKLETVTFKDMNGSSATDMSYMFASDGASLLNNIDLTCFNYNHVTSFERLFDMDWKLTELTLPDNFVTDEATNLNSMFWGTGLKSLDVSGFNTDTVTDMGAMFSYMTSLESLDLSTFNTEKVENMFALFLRTDSLKSLTLGPDFNTSRVSDMVMMFSWTGLEEIDLTQCNFSTASLKKAWLMFSENANLKKVILPDGFFTSQMENLEEMFSRNPKLEEIVFGNDIDTSNVKVLKGMFAECPSFIHFELPAGFNIGDGADASEMFRDCSNLKQIDISDITISETANITDMFKGCNKLTAIIRSKENAGNCTYSFSETPVKAGTKLTLRSANKDESIYYSFNKSLLESGSLFDSDGNLMEGINLYRQDIILSEDQINNAYAAEGHQLKIYAIAIREGYKPGAILEISEEVIDSVNDKGNVVIGDNGDIDNIENVPKSLWVTAIPESVDYTGSAITFPNMKVFWNKTRLEQGTDYTVKYTGNLKAGIATVTISGKGNYTGSIIKKFTIKPLSLGDGSNNNENLTAENIKLIYNNKVQKGTTYVSYKIGDKYVSLKSGIDFKYVYDSTKDWKSEGSYEVKLVGVGNYTGEATFTEQIIAPGSKIAVGSLKIKVKNMAATGEACIPGEAELEIKDSNNKPVDISNFDIRAYNNTLPGTATVVISAKDGIGYAGTKAVTFKITAISIAKAVVEGVVNKEYTGSGLNQDGIRVTLKGETEPLSSDDYEVSYDNNTNVSSKKATVIITGKGRYTGTVKKTFTINPKEILGNNVEIESNYPYTKGGVKPLPIVKDGEKVLTANVDYSLKYANNTTVAGAKKPTVTITGKGNYKGIIVKEFTIGKAQLSDEDLQLTDVKYADKTGICKTTVKLVSKETGATLKAGTDYDKSFKYCYADRTFVEKVENGKRSLIAVNAGSEVDLKKHIIPVGTRIKIVLKGIGFYEGEKTGYFYFTKGILNSASIKIATQYYEGRPVLVDKEDIEIVLDKKVLSKSDYRIISYSNNNKKGSAKITLEGIGNYGGQKTVSFTIAARPTKTTIVFNNNNSYLGDVRSTAPAATGSMSPMQIDKASNLKANTYKRSGFTFKGWSDTPDGEVKYKDKESVDPNVLFPGGAVASYGGKKTLYAVWEPISVKITYIGLKDKNKLEASETVVNDNPTVFDVDEGIPTLKAPEQTGYTFDGWYKDSKFKTKINNIPGGTSKDVTIYAKMTPIKYSIYFEGGDGATPDTRYQFPMVFYYDVTYPMYENQGYSYIPSFQKEGFKFVGWQVKDDESGRVYKNAEPVKNLTAENYGHVYFVAVWEENKF